MKKFLIILLIFLLGAALLVAFPPLSMYVPEIESALSASLGRTAKVGKLSVSVYPRPGILLGDVAISGVADGGAESVADSTTVRFDKIWLEPDVTTLLSPRKEFRRVFINGILLTPETLSALPEMLARANGAGSPFRANGVHFEQATLRFPKLSIENLNGEAVLADSGGLTAVRMRTDDRKLNLSLTPAGQRIDFEADGIGLRIPALAPVDFTSVSIKGAWENGVANVSAFDFRLLDGAIKGQGTVKTEEKNIAVEGELAFEHIDSGKLSAALKIGSLVAGDLDGKATFSGAAAEWESLMSALTAEGNFLIQRGSLTGIDLAEAARRMSDMPVQGGTMSFEQFSGRMRLTSSRSRFHNLVISSGLMHSAGAMEIAANQSISGRLDLQIRGSANQMRIPIRLGGTLQEPTAQAIRPQRGAPTNAAASGQTTEQDAGDRGDQPASHEVLVAPPLHM